MNYYTESLFNLGTKLKDALKNTLINNEEILNILAKLNNILKSKYILSNQVGVLINFFNRKIETNKRFFRIRSSDWL